MFQELGRREGAYDVALRTRCGGGDTHKPDLVSKATKKVSEAGVKVYATHSWGKKAGPAVGPG